MLRCGIIVTGTPGTGKTTLSKRLAKDINAEYLSISQLVAENRLFEGYDKKRRSRIVNLAKARSRVSSTLSTGALTIVDTHTPEGIVPKRMTRQVIVLRCHPSALVRRLRARGWEASKIRENVLAELLDVCFINAVKQYGLLRVVQLDTSRASVRQSVSAAKRVVAKRSSFRTTKIDWITTLEKEGELERYLT
jgi:adenylate kinase